jgi:hypothetical protein
VPVDGAGADPGQARDVVEGHREPVGGERLFGGSQDLRPVAPRVRAHLLHQASSWTTGTLAPSP